MPRRWRRAPRASGLPAAKVAFLTALAGPAADATPGQHTLLGHRLHRGGHGGSFNKADLSNMVRHLADLA